MVPIQRLDPYYGSIYTLRICKHVSKHVFAFF
jgi:hypothetical protein